MTEEERESKGPGATLREARERMQISTRQVAEALHLPVRTIEAIEAEDPKRLPAPVFARGYTRAYARLLELDADAIVAQYPQQDETVERVDLISEPRTGASIIRLGVAALLWILGLGVVAGVVWVVWQWSGDEAEVTGTQSETVKLPKEDADEPASETTPSGRGLPDEAGRPIQEASAAETLSEQPDLRPDPSVERLERQPAADASRRSVPAAATGQPPADSQPGAVAAGAAPRVEDLNALRAAGRRITPEGDDVLRMEFSEDCWVEVMASTGRVLYGDLNRSGRVLVLVGEAPFRVLLGYAPGVRMSFNGEAVVLTPHTRNAVADLVLGQ